MSINFTGEQVNQFIESRVSELKDECVDIILSMITMVKIQKKIVKSIDNFNNFVDIEEWRQEFHNRVLSNEFIDMTLAEVNNKMTDAIFETNKNLLEGSNGRAVENN